MVHRRCAANKRFADDTKRFLTLRPRNGGVREGRKAGGQLAGDWVRSRDGAFQDQANQLIALIASHQSLWGLSETDLTALGQCQQEFEAALSDQAQGATVYHALVADKQAKREALERELRAMVRRINNHPGMTDALRKSMGLASPTRKPTKSACRAEAEGERHS